MINKLSLNVSISMQKPKYLSDLYLGSHAALNDAARNALTLLPHWILVDET